MDLVPVVDRVNDLYNSSERITGLFYVLFDRLETTAFDDPELDYLKDDAESIKLGNAIHRLRPLVCAIFDKASELKNDIGMLLSSLEAEQKVAAYTAALKENEERAFSTAMKGGVLIDEIMYLDSIMKRASQMMLLLYESVLNTEDQSERGRKLHDFLPVMDTIRESVHDAADRLDHLACVLTSKGQV